MGGPVQADADHPAGVPVHGPLLHNGGPGRAVAVRHGAAVVPHPPGTPPGGVPPCCFLLLFESCTLSSAGVLSSASCLSGPCDGAGGGAALTVPSLKDMTTPHAAAMLAKCGSRMCGLPFKRRCRMAWQVGSKTMAGLLQLIQAERNGDTVNRLLLAHLLRMLSALGIYQTSFQVLD